MVNSTWSLNIRVDVVVSIMLMASINLVTRLNKEKKIMTVIAKAIRLLVGTALLGRSG
jgi:hypothetical protein